MQEEKLCCRSVCCDSRTSLLGCVSEINEVIDNPEATYEQVDATTVHLGHLMKHVQNLQAHFQQWKKDLQQAKLDEEAAGGNVIEPS